MNEPAPDSAFPVRRRLPHTPPVSVAQFAAGAPFFVTICADRARYGIEGADAGRVGPLTGGNTAVRLLCELEHFRSRGELTPRVAVVMPDHMHFIASFREDVDMARFIRNMKRRTAREFGIVWQDGFFDHRLRNAAERTDKADYILANPVRKGLCASVEAWPFYMVWPE